MINWLGVALAALSMFLLGGLWYSLLFAKPWQRLAGVSDEQLRSGSARIFAGSFVLAVVAATSLAFFIGDGDLGFGAFAGFAAGLSFVAVAFGITYLFERRPLGLFLINGGYNVVAFTLMGVIIGAF